MMIAREGTCRVSRYLDCVNDEVVMILCCALPSRLVFILSNACMYVCMYVTLLCNKS